MNRTAAARLIAAFAVVLSLTLSAAAPALAQSKTGKEKSADEEDRGAPLEKQRHERVRATGACPEAAQGLQLCQEHESVCGQPEQVGAEVVG
jgi:hypothetical protein